MVKTVTLYPGRYAYICPCGHPYQVMTLYRKTSNVAVYCFACKQQTGKHIRIMDQNIDFAVNSNNKLIGTQAEQKKYIGNAVEVGMAKALCEALARKLIELKSIAA